MPQIFPQALRQPGIVQSGDKVIPAGASGHMYLVLTNIPQSDLDDPAVSFDLRMYIKRNGVYPAIDPAVHNEDSGCTFVGGPNMGKGGGVTVAPGWQENGDVIAGQTVKFWLNVSGRAFTAGLDADQM